MKDSIDDKLSFIDNRRKELETQLNSIELQVTELKTISSQLLAANQHIEQIILKESDKAKRTNLYTILRNNYDLYVKINMAIKEFEDVKFRYHKEIDDLLLSSAKVWLDQMNKRAGQVSDQLLHLLRKVSQLEIPIDINMNDEYRL